MVASDPPLHHLADMLGGMVPDTHEGSFTPIVTYVAGHASKAQVVPLTGRPHEVPQQLADCRHIEPLAGHRFTLGVLGWDGLVH